jgi:hypothetical protein
MSSPVRLPHGPGTPAQRTGQGTEIEKSRAAAEVYYRVAVAKEYPRDEKGILERVRRACANPELAKQAFFAVPKGGGSTAVGPSVHLARELARIWGNIDYGVVELRRDDVAGESEMQAFAWDLETGTRPSHLFIQPHRIDRKTGGPKILTEVNAIYENNANAGARRVREQIFAVLPKAVVDEAIKICRQTLEAGDAGKTPEGRAGDAVAAFKSTFRVTQGQLEKRVGKPAGKWTARDVADLEVLYGSLQKGEVTVDVEFPAETVSVEEINRQSRARRQPPTEEGQDELDQLDAERAQREAEQDAAAGEDQ